VGAFARHAKKYGSSGGCRWYPWGAFRVEADGGKRIRRRDVTCIPISHVDILVHMSCIANAVPALKLIQANWGMILHHIL
jgi:hypothetical protein